MNENPEQEKYERRTHVPNQRGLHLKIGNISSCCNRGLEFVPDWLVAEALKNEFREESE